MSRSNGGEQALRFELGDPKLARRHPAARPILWLSLSCIVIFIVWASLAELDEVTRGDGRVVPHGRLQVIQSLEGGILEKLLVAEGDIVSAGQPLLQLDSTRFRSSYQEAKSKVDGLHAAIARLRAEVLDKQYIDFPSEIDPQGELAASERALFNARRGKYLEAIRSLDKEIGLAKKQLALIEPLVRKQAVSEIEGLRLSKEIAGLSGKLTEIRNSYLQDAYAELSTKQSELSVQEQITLQREDQLRRTEILSPVRGRVNDIQITTRGGVVQPGEPIMEIIPIDDQLLVEAKVKPRDVAFLAPGMQAKVKITAYDYTVYGELTGTLEQISADTIEEETLRGKEAFYKILVKTDSSYLQKGKEILPIKAGMVAEVDVMNGKRSILNYLMSPLFKARLH